MIIKASKLLISFILIIFPYMSFSQTLNGVWTDLDGSSVKPGISDKSAVERISPWMVLDSKDQPHIIWQEGADMANRWKGEIFYKYWNQDEEKWVTYGDADKEGGLTQSKYCSSGYEAAIAIDSKDFPHVLYVATEKDSTDYCLYYRFWDGEKWTSYGGADKFPEPSVLINSNIELYSQSLLSIDENDYPWIVANLDHDPNIIFVFWDGKKWRGYGSSYSEGGIDPSPYIRNNFNPTPKEIINVGGFPIILGTFYGDTDNTSLLVSIEWDGYEWIKTDYGDPGFRITTVKRDSENRFHVAGYSKDLIYNPTCFSFFENNEWKTLGSNGFVFPNTENCSNISLAIDKKNYPHLIYTSNSYPGLHYFFWDGYGWNGREWSQLRDGIHDSANNYKIWCANSNLIIDSRNQPCICFDDQEGLGDYIHYLYNNLTQKHNDLSLGIDTDRYIYESEDELNLSVGMINPDLTRKVNLYLVLENFTTDEYWFFPNWSKEIDFITVTVSPELAIPITKIFSFDIPCESPPLAHDKEKNWIYSYRYIFAAFDTKKNELLDLISTYFKIYPPKNEK